MKRLNAIAILLLFEFSLILPISGSGNTASTVRMLYLLPRFGGYLLLLRLCTHLPDFFARTKQIRFFFSIMLLFELLRWFAALLFYPQTASLLKIAQIVSAIAVLYTLRVINSAVVQLERSHNVTFCAHRLNIIWYCLAIVLLLSFVFAQITVLRWATALANFFICVCYCIHLGRTICTFFHNVPPQVAKAYE